MCVPLCDCLSLSVCFYPSVCLSMSDLRCHLLYTSQSFLPFSPSMPTATFVAFPVAFYFIFVLNSLSSSSYSFFFFTCSSFSSSSSSYCASFGLNLTPEGSVNTAIDVHPINAAQQIRSYTIVHLATPLSDLYLLLPLPFTCLTSCVSACSCLYLPDHQSVYLSVKDVKFCPFIFLL